MAGRIETLIRSRGARLTLAVGMGTCGILAFSPYVLSEVSQQAYVNAPLIRLASPISGTVTSDLPLAGSYVAAPTSTRLVRARSLESDALGALVGQRDALDAARDLATRQLVELVTADTRLARLGASYKHVAVDRLVATTNAARADALACTAEADAADLQSARVNTLAARGFAARVTVEQASSAAAALRAHCAAYTARAVVAADETGAARTGMYLANGSSDTPYVVQERDRLLLRRQELDTIAVDARTRLAELDTRIGAEQRRLTRVAAYDAMLPGGSIVWAVAASPGASVAPGSALMDLADCRHRFVEVTLPERRIEALVPGRKVDVRLIGADEWQTGHIIRSAGAAARRDVAMVAASDGDRDPRALTVEVALPLAPKSALSRRCDIGRLAEVRISRWNS